MTVHTVRNGCSSTVTGLCQWQASDGEGVQRPHRYFWAMMMTTSLLADFDSQKQFSSPSIT